MGIVGVIGTIGNLGSYVLTAFLCYALGWSWRLAFTHLAVGVAVMAIGAPMVPSECWTSESPTQPSAWNALHAVLRRPTFCCLALLIAIMWYTISAVEYFALVFVNETFHTDPNVAAKLYVVAGIGSGLGVAFGSYVSDRLGGYTNRRSSFLFVLAMSL